MADLIACLRDEHAAIAAVLGRIRQEGAATRNGRRLLEQLREEVEHHFAREAQELYPALRRSAATAPRLRAMLELLAREADELLEEAEKFFVRSAAGENGLALARDFGRLYAALAARMDREEATLFPAYERMVLAGEGVGEPKAG
jgi:iron-sulfur cluster repair protein YtfE (RIC family)